MAQFKLYKLAYAAGLSIIGLMLFSATVAAQSAKVDGVIKGRSGNWSCRLRVLRMILSSS